MREAQACGFYEWRRDRSGSVPEDVCQGDVVHLWFVLYTRGHATRKVSTARRYSGTSTSAVRAAA
jgi:hypothetical protein